MMDWIGWSADAAAGHQLMITDTDFHTISVSPNKQWLFMISI